MNKAELLQECVRVLNHTSVAKWYEENLKGKSQGETIDSLNRAVLNNQLSIYQALCIALIVGFQWNVKFKGVS